MTFRHFRISLKDDGRGPYEIATDDVQESQRRLKRRFRIVLENFPEILYAGERGGTRGQAGINIYHTRGQAVSTFIIRAGETWARGSAQSRVKTMTQGSAQSSVRIMTQGAP